MAQRMKDNKLQVLFHYKNTNPIEDQWTNVEELKLKKRSPPLMALKRFEDEHTS